MAQRYPAYVSMRHGPGQPARSRPHGANPRPSSGVTFDAMHAPGGWLELVAFMNSLKISGTTQVGEQGVSAQMSTVLLEQQVRVQFGCYWLLTVQQAEGTAFEALRERYQSALPDNDDHIRNIIFMTTAVLRLGAPKYLERAWPIRYAAELSVDFMSCSSSVDELLSAINRAIDAKAPVTRATVHAMQARLQAEKERTRQFSRANGADDDCIAGDSE